MPPVNALARQPPGSLAPSEPHRLDPEPTSAMQVPPPTSPRAVVSTPAHATPVNRQSLLALFARNSCLAPHATPRDASVEADTTLEVAGAVLERIISTDAPKLVALEAISNDLLSLRLDVMQRQQDVKEKQSRSEQANKNAKKEIKELMPVKQAAEDARQALEGNIGEYVQRLGKAQEALQNSQLQVQTHQQSIESTRHKKQQLEARKAELEKSQTLKKPFLERTETSIQVCGTLINSLQQVNGLAITQHMIEQGCSHIKQERLRTLVQQALVKPEFTKRVQEMMARHIHQPLLQGQPWNEDALFKDLAAAAAHAVEQGPRRLTRLGQLRWEGMVQHYSVKMGVVGIPVMGWSAASWQWSKSFITQAEADEGMPVILQCAMVLLSAATVVYLTNEWHNSSEHKPSAVQPEEGTANQEAVQKVSERLQKRLKNEMSQSGSIERNIHQLLQLNPHSAINDALSKRNNLTEVIDFLQRLQADFKQQMSEDQAKWESSANQQALGQATREIQTCISDLGTQERALAAAEENVNKLTDVVKKYDGMLKNSEANVKNCREMQALYLSAKLKIEQEVRSAQSEREYAQIHLNTLLGQIAEAERFESEAQWEGEQLLGSLKSHCLTDRAYRLITDRHVNIERKELFNRIVHGEFVNAENKTIFARAGNVASSYLSYAHAASAVIEACRMADRESPNAREGDTRQLTVSHNRLMGVLALVDGRNKFCYVFDSDVSMVRRQGRWLVSHLQLQSN